MRVTRGDYQLAKLVRWVCVGDENSGSQTKNNPYSTTGIQNALHYLGYEYNVHYLDAAEVVIARYEKENA